MKQVRVMFSDLNGCVKGKLIPADNYAHDKIFRWPRSILVQDIEGDEVDIKGFSPDSGDKDLEGHPDAATFVPAPGHDDMMQVILDTHELGGHELAVSPRAVLKRVLHRAKELGFEVKVASELEFYVTKQDGRSLEVSELEQPYGDINALDNLKPLINDFLDATKAVGLTPEAVLSETGQGQLEINFAPDDPLAMADKTLYFKQMIRDVARANRLDATFLARPFGSETGSGYHVHISLWQGGQNVFGSDSAVIEHFAAGLALRSADVMAFIAPNPNSYRRYALAHGYVPNRATMGDEDRRAAIRITGSGASRHIEHRVAGSDANPYLLIASLLAAGLDGVKHRMTTDQAVVKLAMDLPFAEHLLTAVENLEQSEFVREQLGHELVEAFAAIKRQELRKFAQYITDWERSTYGTQV